MSCRRNPIDLLNVRSWFIKDVRRLSTLRKEQTSHLNDVRDTNRPHAGDRKFAPIWRRGQRRTAEGFTDLAMFFQPHVKQ